MVRSPIFEDRSAGWQTRLQVSRRVHIWRRLPAPRAIAGFLLALVVVVVVAVMAGGVLARWMLVVQAPATAVVPSGHLAEAGGLLLQVAAVTWLVRAPGEGPRLRVDFRLQNPTDQTQAIGPHEFQLHAPSGATWPAAGDSMAATTLAPLQALIGTLVFNVPGPVTGLSLVWTTDRREVQLPLGTASAGLPPNVQGREGVTEHHD
jgi:hypothetical protein